MENLLDSLGDNKLREKESHKYDCYQTPGQLNKSSVDKSGVDKSGD